MCVCVCERRSVREMKWIYVIFIVHFNLSVITASLSGTMDSLMGQVDASVDNELMAPTGTNTGTNPGSPPTTGTPTNPYLHKQLQVTSLRVYL